MALRFGARLFGLQNLGELQRGLGFSDETFRTSGLVLNCQVF